jgi:hypothetical protein
LALSASRPPEVVIGTIVRLAESGAPEVEFPANPSAAPVTALTTAAIHASQVGRQAALVFVEGDPLRPLIVGLIHHPAAEPQTREAPAIPGEIEARLDGGRVVLTAEREIELRCGKSSLVLTRAGKVLIRGAYLLSRSSGVNRIKGGSVQIN